MSGGGTKNSGAHGYAAEEALRTYFISLGYFAVRGAPVRAFGEEVTDVDLWLYHRHSPLLRERTNVDIKNKRRAHAMERVLVALGIKEALGLDRCIVATTDNREAVVHFGRNSGVIVFGGRFVASLQSKHSSPLDRLTEEELLAGLDFDGLGKITGHWTERFTSAKGWLLTDLGFDACNRYLEELAGYLDTAAMNPQRRESGLRLACVTAAFFLISLDYAMASFAFETVEDRRQAMHVGLRFGSDGRERVEKLAGLASQLAAHVTKSSPNQYRSAITELFEESDDSAAALAEFFSKGAIANAFLPIAHELESLAYSKPFRGLSSLGAEARATIGLLVDYAGVERNRIF